MDKSTAVEEIKRGLDRTLGRMKDENNMNSKEKSVEESFYAIETMAWAHAACYFNNTEIKAKLETLRNTRSDVQRQLDQECWTLRQLTEKMKEAAAETKITQKELLVYKMGVLREEIKKTNDAIAEAEESSKKGQVLKISKIIVDHVKGLAEVFLGFATENPYIIGLGFVSLAETTWEDFHDLTETVDGKKIRDLEKALKEREKELKEDEEKLRKINMRKPSFQNSSNK